MIVMMLIFCMQITMKSCYKLILGIWLGWSSILKVPKIASSQCPYKFSKKKLDLKLIFCMQTNIKVSYKLISVFVHQSFLQGDTIITDGHDHKHSQSASSNKVAISLQYLKKEVRNEVHLFHADKHQSLTTNQLCSSDMFWVSTAVVLVKNDV